MAAARTTQILAAAQDEVSVAIAGLFGTHAQEFHAASAQAPTWLKLVRIVGADSEQCRAEVVG